MTEQSDHNTEPSVEVYVATHKKIDFEIPDYCRKIQVNAERNGQWEGYLHDNDNPDNISLKNPNYCELTALYAMWKNCKADIQGLCHYRRYFSKFDMIRNSRQRDPWQHHIHYSEIMNAIITKQAIISELKHVDVLILFPQSSDYLNILEVFSAYVQLQDLHTIYEIFEDYYSDYLPALEHVLGSKRFSQCNMFIARRDFVNKYCTWLFDVLARIEERISFDGDDDIHARVYGYFSEFLLNVYIKKHNLHAKYFLKVIVSFSSLGYEKLKYLIKKLPFLVKCVQLMRGNREYDVNVDNFFIEIKTINLSARNYFIAKFTPKHKDNLLVNLEEAMNELKAEASRENRTFLPQIVLSKEAPESLRKSLWDSGVRILEG